MPKILRDFNEMEQNAFVNMFESKEYKSNAIFESIGSKLYRHEYCLVQHDMVKEVISWFENCGLNVKITDDSHWLQTQIEMV